MASHVQRLARLKLIPGAPEFVPSDICYEVVMGSVAFGVSNDSSDMDIYGFCIPPRSDVYPHLRGEITGFDQPSPPFAQYQQHHIDDPSALGGTGRTYDLSIYSIVKYFRLCIENNPNMIDSLFVPDRCILHMSSIGEQVRASRHMFLHRGVWQKFKGYAYGQMHKLRTRQAVGKRTDLVKAHGYDTKFAYHYW